MHPSRCQWGSQAGVLLSLRIPGPRDASCPKLGSLLLKIVGLWGAGCPGLGSLPFRIVSLCSAGCPELGFSASEDCGPVGYLLAVLS